MNDKKFTNSLINESSPYLLQHAHNPVNWFPWGDDALNKAKEENKLLIISIGYSACHWCHVMEHESFEDTVVAKVMNEFYVSIKVDREERPDVDQIYMDAAYLLTGRGGWPLNVIALPDGKPVFAGTYFTKPQWLKVINYFSELYKKDPQSFHKEADKITNAISNLNLSGLNEEFQNFSKDELKIAVEQILENIDFDEGGTLGAPKFPMPNIFDFLLQQYYHTNNEEALKAITITLDKISNGGIYDHIGGGFARYSTDDIWKVPHFEKMLYDNAQLVTLFSNAFKVTKSLEYKKVVYETLEFIDREMTDKSGGFYSALDADSEGEEGKYYVWSKKEIDDILGEDSELFCRYYSVSESGNWEGKNILYVSNDKKEIINDFKISEEVFNSKLLSAKEKLLKERMKRIQPGLDDKILTSWNALMLKGYVDAYMAFDDKDFLKKAEANAEFIATKMLNDDSRLYRNYKNGKSSINAFLDDYAFTIEAYLRLYEATFNEKWLNLSKQLADYSMLHFYDKKLGMFFFTSDLDDPLISRKIDHSDNVTPSSNSSMADALIKLSKYFYEEGYRQTAEKLIASMKELILKNAPFHAKWLIAISNVVNPYYEVAVVGSNYLEIANQFQRKYIPNISLAGTKDKSSLDLLKNKLVDGKTMIYVCENQTCNLPTESIEQAVTQIIIK